VPRELCSGGCGARRLDPGHVAAPANSPEGDGRVRTPATLLAGGPPPPGVANLDVDASGAAWLPEDDFLQHFAADVPPVKARVMFAAQQPLAMSAFADVMGTPAWKSLPTWYMVAENDEVIPPDAERHFAQRMGAVTVEAASSHVAMVSHPDEVVDLVNTALKGVDA
jgi:pimeloyl-ACP methyl ester carboxylesterase